MSKKPRFPIPRYPRGWFQVAYSDELKAGEVQPLKYFGVELVMFRTEDGEVSVLDAFCPHMGAHLGYGGKVDGDGIVCPFHAWKFNGEGKCTEVPYAEHLPRKANITTWPVHEVNGLIMVWHDIEGKEPEWEIPEIPEWNNDAWTPYWKQRWKMRTHNQDMCENVVDKAHFRYVHGMNIVPQPHTMDLVYPHIHMVTDTAMETPRGDVTGELEVDVHGFGFSLSRFRGIVETTNMASVTPIDDEYCDVRFSFTVKKLGWAPISPLASGRPSPPRSRASSRKTPPFGRTRPSSSSRCCAMVTARSPNSASGASTSTPSGTTSRLKTSMMASRR